MRSDADQIKKLEEEKTVLAGKITAANCEIMGLRDRLRDYEQGAAEVRRTVDMLLAATALKYGAQVGEDARELVLRDVGPELLERWRVLFRVEEKNGDYLIRAERRSTEAE